MFHTLTYLLLHRNTHLSLGFGVLRTLSSSSSSGPLSLGFSNSTLSRSRSSSSTSGGGSAGSCSESSTFTHTHTHTHGRLQWLSSSTADEQDGAEFPDQCETETPTSSETLNRFRRATTLCLKFCC